MYIIHNGKPSLTLFHVSLGIYLIHANIWSLQLRLWHTLEKVFPPNELTPFTKWQIVILPLFPESFKCIVRFARCISAVRFLSGSILFIINLFSKMNYFLNLDGLYKKKILSKNTINHAHKHKHNPKHIQRKAAEKINLDGNLIWKTLFCVFRGNCKWNIIYILNSGK